MDIKRLDHFVITVQDIERSCRFYHQILGMQIITFDNGRKALRFADMKINLHQVEHEFEPKAAIATPGTADICFIVKTHISDVLTELRTKNIPIEQGPVPKNGALGPIESIYFRDPDKNLIELANYR
ncbi:biphenyl-2,3-diol 1,2-dioxygenase III-related protein [Liquorilactobacillus sucicola DSM 21376 = JCM 15457]|uniref:Dioxygenase n=1 Tax=Liquorilactobacillus sucicola DSM 21376 = JCM 15457 TaxID=1423806 RepID=A0A023CVN0_9LACO|nr:VOC family protein [Liquorilactobacillus sucicola]KRN05559.1 dioxygenase [Liquorilactobacillus sucicola DSM 21376 = JCM 15457]GAJ25641.1 biphenyl-2,3-diol 1,2-dioxygenase III-related protein [Liquorilactobacillus sucicola DSM 21376 = JCM 15457]